ncbi:hypothetical protein PYCCODRAFT_1439303 [Trametes coccinea BRFM310]|uniref:Uncharacterized protein n=1 Tax=Trametes coccinea (strain BRFM310) TaxID=1353009 RepID=A0A1Y2ICM2_TRAC3|nr:hypothetical protein PYCCODRAFT_1439303 [Trametes coccinea BRFM310]
MPADRVARTQLKQTTLVFSKAAVSRRTHATTDDASDAPKTQLARPKPFPLLSKGKGKAKAASGNEDRVLTDVVLSIKPEFTQVPCFAPQVSIAHVCSNLRYL